MTKLEDLIANLCPNGVEYKRFDEACTLNARIGWQRLTRAEFQKSGEYMLITGTDFTSAYTVNYDTCVYVSEERYLQDKKIQIKNGDVLVTKDGTLGKVAFVNDLSKPATLNGGVFVVRSKDGSLLGRYVMYYLLSSHFSSVVEAQKTGSTISHLTQALFSRLLIPVPPLPVQEEIVRILDKFTALSQELSQKLSQELSLRKKQYEYYRDDLLNDNCAYPLVRLGDFSSIFRGGNFQKKDFVDSGKPCIHYGQIYTYFGAYTYDVKKYLTDETFLKSKKAATNDVVMAITSENLEDVCLCTAWLGKEEIAVSGHTAIIRHNQNAKYLSYYFHSKHFFEQKKRIAYGTKVIEVSPVRLQDVLIPLPSIEEQNKIADVLDRFDKLTTDLSSGLPAEISARRKQYEYYRDLLLTFPAKAN